MAHFLSRHVRFVPLALCVGLAALPPAPRGRVRQVLLGWLTRLPRDDPAAADPASSSRPHSFATRLSLLEAECARLRAALAAAHAGVPEGQPAVAIVARLYPISGHRDLVRRAVLVAGREAGVVEGAPVVRDGALVGVVDRVGRDRSEVRLVTDPAFRLRVELPCSKREGIARGRGDAHLELRLAAAAGVLLPEAVGAEPVLVSPASTICSVPLLLGRLEVDENGEGERIVPAVALDAPAFVAILSPPEEPCARLAEGGKRALPAG